MQYFGVSAARLQMAALTVMALALGGCKIDSGAGSTTSAGQSSNASMGTATLTWIAPAENTNGTPLTDLAGSTEFEVSGLTPGTYYFSVSAYTSMGAESAGSTVESKSI